MEDRRVTRTEKDEDGDITALCNPSADWKRCSKSLAISDIENETYRYYVEVGDKEVDVLVVKGQSGKHLRTSPDPTVHNNLDDLPDC